VFAALEALLKGRLFLVARPESARGEFKQKQLAHSHGNERQKRLCQHLIAHRFDPRRQIFKSFVGENDSQPVIIFARVFDNVE